LLTLKTAIMEKITDVLGRNHPQFNTVAPTTTVKDALYKMYCEHVDYLIVLENHKFVGLLTEHEVAGKVLFSDKPLQNTIVKEFMTTQVPVVSDEDSLEYGMQLLEHHNARYLAVYDGFDFKAIVSAQDLMRLALKGRKVLENTETLQR
jgi:predicted transcriptional regulator